MVLSCNIFFQGLSDTAFFLVQTWCFYHKKIVTWKLQHFYHKEVMMLSFFHGWEIIVESVNLTQMSKQKIIITMMENNYFLIGISEKWDRAPGTRDSGPIRGTWVPGERSQLEVPGTRVPCMGPASWVPLFRYTFFISKHRAKKWCSCNLYVIALYYCKKRRIPNYW